MSLQICLFCLLQFYFLSVGVAKRDVMRGTDADKSIAVQIILMPSNVKALIQRLGSLAFIIPSMELQEKDREKEIRRYTYL